MFYNPISLDVIRQALRDSNVPSPLRAHQIDQYTTRDGGTITDYVLTFPMLDIHAALCAAAPAALPITLAGVAVLVGDCFCEDVVVIDVQRMTERLVYFVTIETFLDPHDFE